MNDQGHNFQLQIPKGVPILIGMPFWVGEVPIATMLSVASTVDHCARMGIDVAIITRQGSHIVARDGLFEDFITSNAERLFWIDGDMTWKAEDFLRLLGFSFMPGHDVMCAAYPLKRDGQTFIVNADSGSETGEFGLLKIKGAGLGFTVVSRQACEALAATKELVIDEFNGETSHAVFRFDTIEGGRRRSEDMAFFADLAELGFPTYCDPSIELGHIGPREWKGRLLDVMKITTEPETV